MTVYLHTTHVDHVLNMNYYNMNYHVYDFIYNMVCKIYVLVSKFICSCESEF